MSGLSPLPVDQRKIDEGHLKLLSIFHFVGAGLALLGIGFLCLHYAFMHAIFTNPKLFQDQKGGPPPAEIFAIMKWFYVLGGIWFVVSGILNLISGLFLQARKHWVFSMVVAGINCLHMPLGTVLGVFTLIVLSRASVKELYGTV
jgi:hypothetical protein